MFGSYNILNFESPSRRDDLISLCYLLIYILQGSLPFMELNQERLSLSQRFKKLRLLKNLYTPEKLCDSEETKILLPFIKNVFAIGFDEEPDYSKLNFCLLKALLDLDQVPSRQFDWIEQSPLSERNGAPPNELSLQSFDMSVLEDDSTIAHVNNTIIAQKMKK